MTHKIKKLFAFLAIAALLLSGAYFVLGGYGASGPDAAPNLDEYGLVGYWNMEEGKGQTVYDRSGNANNGTLGGTTAVQKSDPVFTSGYSSSGPGGTALKFDGVDDYVDAGAGSSLNFGTGAFSVEMWLKPTALATTGTLINTGGVNVASGFALQKASGTLYFYINGTTGDLIKYSYFTDTNWVHVVATRDNSGNLKAYKNGIDTTASGSDASSLDNSQGFSIGARPAPLNYPSYFSGSIDEVRIYNRALSADEIRQHYNQKKPVMEMKFDEGSGTVARDESFNNNDATFPAAPANPTWSAP